MTAIANWNIDGKSHEKNFKSIVFLGVLWLSLFVAFLFLIILLVTTAMNGWGRYDLRLFTTYNNTTPADAMHQGDLDTALAYGSRVAQVAAKLRA